MEHPEHREGRSGLPRDTYEYPERGGAASLGHRYMNISLWPYLALTSLGYGLAYPGAALLRLAGRDRRGLSQRLGRVEPGLPHKDGPRIWMQAVSVGEVHLAAGLLAELKKRRPGLDLVLSTTTETGRAEAGRLMAGTARVVYFPYDTYPGARRAVRAIDPDLLVLVETELWPLILARVLDHGAGVAMVNGRISDNSARGYRFLAPWFRPLLARFRRVGAVGEEDAERLVNLGVSRDRLKVTGNAKQDSLAFRADRAQVLAPDRSAWGFADEGRSGWPVPCAAARRRRSSPPSNRSAGKCRRRFWWPRPGIRSGWPPWPGCWRRPGWPFTVAPG